jgi:hypothetical protein
MDLPSNERIMSKHLAKKEIKKLLHHQIEGKKCVYMLEHLEICAYCRSRVQFPSPTEIIKRFVVDLPEILSSNNRGIYCGH